jgi:hypothetical protein
MERTVAGAFRYELVAEDGEPLGDLTSDNGSWKAGDLIPCRGHMFEIQSVEDETLHVRRVI